MNISTETLATMDFGAITGFTPVDRYLAVRTQQGGRDVYTVQIPLADVPRVLPVPDPARPTPGNRRVNPSHAKKFGQYVREHPEWVAPPLLIRDSGECMFKPLDQKLPGGVELGILEVPRTSRTALRIIDGQHRVLGLDMGLRDLDIAIDEAREKKAKAEHAGKTAEVQALNERLRELLAERERFETEHLVVTIYEEGLPQAYEQMFFDVADNALGINQAVTVRFDSRRLLNRTLTEVSKHALLENRVDMEQDRVKGTNPNLLGAKHVIDIVRAVTVGVSGRISKKREEALDEGTVVQAANEFLDALVDGFPPLNDLADGKTDVPTLRSTTLLGSVTMLRVLAGVFFNLTEEDWTPDEIADFFVRLAPHMSAPVARDSIWIVLP